jgi:hypothetical protein
MSADKERLNVFVCAYNKVRRSACNKLHRSLADISTPTNELGTSNLISIEQTKRSYHYLFYIKCNDSVTRASFMTAGLTSLASTCHTPTACSSVQEASAQT